MLGLLLGTATGAGAWDVRCEQSPGGVECTDPLDNVRHPWEPHARSEHRALLQRSLELSGLPGSFQFPFELTVFSNHEPFEAHVREFPVVPDVGVIGEPVFTTYAHESVAPVRRGATRRRLRVVSIPGMASLPDFAYTLWDWASGNETCPPDPGNLDPVDCHNYETHIGWLNSNHMLPQGRRFYEHLHGLALAAARRCREIVDDLPALHIPRFLPYVLQCEKQAIVLEAVGQHYLQDAWATGHMWERWGGPEIAHFGNDRALGFVVAALTGLIHGGKAAFDETFPFSALKPWDDPMNAPFEGVFYLDGQLPAGPLFPGVGDVFLPLLDPTQPDPEKLLDFQFVSYDAQRFALLGCAIDGLREVYAETAQFHGGLGPAVAGEFDASRRVSDGSCWDQRVTNRAIAAGCGVHVGRFGTQIGVELDDSPGGFVLLLTQSRIAPLVADAPQLSGDLLDQFRADSAYACTLAHAMALDPETAEGTDLASGGLPAIAGIGPNSQYARGGPGTEPASWADPFFPWTLNETDQSQLVAKRALNLAFSDANAADRCADYSEADLNEFRDLVAAAVQAGDPAVVDARCGQCVQQVVPHLRFGVEGNHDSRREAFCAFVGPPTAAFVYTGEDPDTFTGSEPTDLPAIEAATERWCGCFSEPPILAGAPAGVHAYAGFDVDGNGFIGALERDSPLPIQGQVAPMFVETIEATVGPSVGLAAQNSAIATTPNGGIILTAILECQATAEPSVGDLHTADALAQNSLSATFLLNGTTPVSLTGSMSASGFVGQDEFGTEFGQGSAFVALGGIDHLLHTGSLSISESEVLDSGVTFTAQCVAGAGESGPSGAFPSASASVDITLVVGNE